jgi:polyphosphate kinase
VIRRLNLPAPDEAAFSALGAKRHPLGLRASKPTYRLMRETYFDTTDGALEDRNMTLRLRALANGHAVVELAIAEEVSLQGIIEETVLETPIVDGGLYATLAGPSEVSTRVRALVEPDALRPRAALDVDREIRDLRGGMFGRVTHRISFDEVVAHAPGVTGAFQEITITEVSRGHVGLEALAERLRDDYGIVADGRDTYERIRGALMAPKGAPRPETPHDVRIALMMMRDWEVALVDDPDGLKLPTARGTGEEIAREYLAEIGGEGGPEEADLDLVGFATARRGGSDLEVWLHQRVGGDKPSGFVWLPLVELMERLGGPRLRDDGLIATLLMLVRSEAGLRLLREAPQRRGAPRTVLTALRRTGVPPGDAPEDFLDLELSILDFNQRVLELVEDAEIPLLERFRFLSIFAANNDEFFVVRVGRVKVEVSEGESHDDAHFTPEQLLDLVAVRVRALVARQYDVFNEVLLPALAEQGIRILTWDDLREDQKSGLATRFEREIFPLLTPLAMSSGPGRPFPRLVNLGLALAVVLRRGGGDRTELGLIPVPEDLERFLQVPGSDDFIALEHVVGANASALFPSASVDDAYAFRASRLGDVDIDEDNTGSLLAAVADEVEERPYKPVIRIEVEARMPREVRAYILKGVRAEQTSDAPTVTRSDVYEVDGPLDLSAIAELSRSEARGLVYEPYHPSAPSHADRSIFDVLAEGDVLCHHPYHDFDATVGRFLREAADDPHVVSIKLTLYRTGRRSPIVDALLRALEAGKDVAVFVELKARFDEVSNIHWTHRLADAGARVVYGVVGYKTHAKTALVVRREAGDVRRYVHVGTGNYNASTARFYTDLGLMSADPDLGADLNDFFNELTGAAGPPQKRFRRLLVAPSSLVQELERMIAREVEHAVAGRPARIQAKMNGLADQKIVRALYEAASKGVQVDLIVRSICTLRPGVEGLSEGIRVRSILGRFLEHARITYFENGGQGEYFIGSADWRARNLRRRVEVVTPVDDPGARAVLRAVLDSQLDDPRAWVLRPDGVFERLRGLGPTSQQHFMRTGGGLEPTSLSRARAPR